MIGLNSMLPTLKKLSASSTYPEHISILVVSPHSTAFSALRQILHHCQWDITHVKAVSEAQRHLSQRAASVIVCERDLPDGCWKDVLKAANNLHDPPMLLVVSRYADDALWAEVLNLGGYDVLLKPFDKAEVARVVGMAWRQWWGASNGVPARDTQAQYFHTA